MRIPESRELLAESFIHAHEIINLDTQSPCQLGVVTTRAPALENRPVRSFRWVCTFDVVICQKMGSTLGNVAHRLTRLCLIAG